MKKSLQIILLGIFIISLNACTGRNAMIGNDRIYHNFSFNTWEFNGRGDKDTVEIMDFLYGSPNGYAARYFKERGETRGCPQGTNETVNMPRKDLQKLYVKWKDKPTGKVQEVSLDLTKKLPKNFGEDHRMFFSFKRDQLYVYVITPDRRAPDEPPNGPRASDYLKTITIYPEQ
ncbi:MAG: hypothetical protein HOP26_05870 [Methylotenera sp.]|nr:hypothetical protein [Methylotenera sp.]MDD4927107.1 hypothetical protein [Methylotenera sp.]NOS95929.1 hypothetical protein [Methylotenera sp.]NOU39762.1 hypothetical protein [Methylotenera sp.]